MALKTWRERFAPIIARVIRESAGGTEREIRRALRDAWPCGPRTCYPYKAWLKEINAQRDPRHPPSRPPLEKENLALPLEDP